MATYFWTCPSVQSHLCFFNNLRTNLCFILQLWWANLRYKSSMDPAFFNSVLSFVCNGCQPQLESSVCLAFYPISGGYLCESECKNWPELERCSTTTRFDLLDRLYILPMRNKLLKTLPGSARWQSNILSSFICPV